MIQLTLLSASVILHELLEKKHAENAIVILRKALEDRCFESELVCGIMPGFQCGDWKFGVGENWQNDECVAVTIKDYKYDNDKKMKGMLDAWGIHYWEWEPQ